MTEWEIPMEFENNNGMTFKWWTSSEVDSTSDNDDDDPITSYYLNGKIHVM